MNNEHRSLTDDEWEVLRLLRRWEGQQFSLEQLIESTNLDIDTAEKVLLALKKRDFIEVSMMDSETSEAGKPSLETSLLNVQRLLDRLWRLAARKDSTKTTVFDRVRERLNEELSVAIANLEFAADRTHDRLTQLARKIEESKDRIDEANVSFDIGEIPRAEADKRIGEYRAEIAKLEAQRKEVSEAGLEVREPDVSRRQRLENESRRLRSLLEELDVRKQVGEFHSRDRDYSAERERILADIASLSEQQVHNGVLVGRGHDTVRTAKTLVDGQVLLEEIFVRLSRACERIGEMNSFASSDHGK